MNRFPRLPVNHNAFDEIDTAEKAYLVGILLADGCVNEAKPKRSSARVNLKILAGDIQACRMAQQVAGGCLRYMEAGYRVIWEVSSNPIAAALERLGITPRKTFTAALAWDLIPPSLHGAVLAGLIDGDGHLRIGQGHRRAEITILSASKALRDQLLERFEFFRATTVLPRGKSRSIHYRIEAPNNRLLLGGLMAFVYDGLPIPVLERKQKVVEQLRAYLQELDAYDQRMGQVTAMKAQGMTINEIAAALGTSRRPIMERLKNAGIDSRQLVFSEVDFLEMKRLAAEGNTVLQVHSAIGKGTEQAVRYHLQRMGCISKKKAVAPPERHPDADGVLAAHKGGLAAYEIAAERGMCPRVVCRILRQDGVQLHRGSARKLTDDQALWAEMEMKKGRTLAALAQNLGVSATLIRMRLKMLRATSAPSPGHPNTPAEELRPAAGME